MSKIFFVVDQRDIHQASHHVDDVLWFPPEQEEKEISSESFTIDFAVIGHIQSTLWGNNSDIILRRGPRCFFVEQFSCRYCSFQRKISVTTNYRLPPYHGSTSSLLSAETLRRLLVIQHATPIPMKKVPCKI